MLFFIFGYFCPFTSLTAQKMKISKKWKKTPGDIIILHKCTKTHDHTLYCSWDMAGDGCKCCFSFCAIFSPSLRNSPKKENFKKNEKNTWRYHHFTCVYQKLWLDNVQFLRYGAQQADGQTDGKSDVKRWVPHLKHL